MNPNHIRLQDAFDRHADTYDERFSKPALGGAIRAEVWHIADRAFEAAHSLLDLGSGTGEDAIHFAQMGIHVTAVDISPVMLTKLQAKASAAGVAGKMDFVVGEMNQYSPGAAKSDGIISNFGAVNCLSDLNWLRDLARLGLNPGSRLVLTTMGYCYPLETAVFVLKGRFAQAFRRLRTPCNVTIEGVSVRVHYHSLSAMRRMLGADFQLEKVSGLRAFLPVPGWEHLNRRSLFQWLAPLDRMWCRWRVTATCADHFVSVWRYQP